MITWMHLPVSYCNGLRYAGTISAKGRHPTGMIPSQPLGERVRRGLSLIDQMLEL